MLTHKPFNGAQPPFGSCVLNHSHPLTKDLQLYFLLNEGRRRFIANLNPYRGRHGLLSSAGSVPAWVSLSSNRLFNKGYGLDFDGSDGFVNITEGGLINPSPITMSAWYRHDGAGEGGTGNILHKSNRWFLAMVATNALQFARDYATQDLLVTTNNDVLVVGNWHYVASTWNGSGTASTDVKIFVNGFEVGGYQTQQNGTGGVSTDSGQQLRIGNNAGETQTANGVITNVKLWTRTLSPQEIYYDYINPFAMVTVPTRRRKYRRSAVAASITGIMTPRTGWWGDL